MTSQKTEPLVALLYIYNQQYPKGDTLPCIWDGDCLATTEAQGLSTERELTPASHRGWVGLGKGSPLLVDSYSYMAHSRC